MDQNQEIAQRISKVRETFCKGDNVTFAELVGVTPQTSSSACSGKRVSGKFVKQVLEAFPRVSYKWLMLGIEPMLKGDPIVVMDQPVSSEDDTAPLPGESTVDRLIRILDQKEDQIKSRDNTIAEQKKEIEDQKKLIEYLTKVLAQCDSSKLPPLN